MPAETSDAPAIVAAERCSIKRASTDRCRCLVLDHMAGLLRCHAEFREPLLTSWGGGGGGGGGGAGGGGSGRVSSGGNGGGGRVRRRLELSDGRDAFGRRVWRQRPAVAVSAHQVRVFRSAVCTYILPPAACLCCREAFMLFVFGCYLIARSRAGLSCPQDVDALFFGPPLGLWGGGIGRNMWSIFLHALMF